MLEKVSRRLLGVMFSACKMLEILALLVAAMFVVLAYCTSAPRACPPRNSSLDNFDFTFRPSKLTPTADKVRRPYTSRYRSHTDCHRWPPLRSMLRSSRSVCSAHAPEPQISQTDATDRHQALQPPPVGPLYAYAIPGIGGQRTDVDLEQALTPHGASPRVSTTASAGGSRARLLCPRYGLPSSPQHADDWIKIKRGCGGME